MNAAIICELNPFHNGHRALFDYARQIAGDKGLIIAFMSGNYVQRGEPALFDKWTRARIALKCGADAVFEIPSVYAAQSAQFFAEAAIRLIQSTNLCDALVFGTEAPDFTVLKQIAEEASPTEKDLKQAFSQGLSYPRAMEQFSHWRCGSNDILAIEYLRALRKYNLNLELHPMQRVGSSHHGDQLISTGNIASATSLRSRMISAPNDPESFCAFLPEEAREDTVRQLGSGQYVPGIRALGQYILGYFRTCGPNAAEKLPFAANGLGTKIYNECCKTNNPESIISACTSKRYPASRIRRILLSAVTGATPADLQSMDVRYLRLLGIRASQTSLLSRLETSSTLPVIYGNVPKDYEQKLPLAANLLSREIIASSVYTLGMITDELPIPQPEFSIPLIKV